MQAGRYKGRGIKDSGAWTDAGTGTLQLCIGLDLKDQKGGFAGSASCFLSFTDKAATYSIERLRALGWEGKGPSDLADLSGIDKNDVDVEVREERWNNKDVWKVEILTGPGRVVIENPIDPKIAAARVAAMLGVGGTAAPGGGAAGKPEVKAPF